MKKNKPTNFDNLDEKIDHLQYQHDTLLESLGIAAYNLDKFLFDVLMLRIERIERQLLSLEHFREDIKLTITYDNDLEGISFDSWQKIS